MKRVGKKKKIKKKYIYISSFKKTKKRFIVRYGTFPTALLINRCGLYDGSVGTIWINVPESRIKR